MERIRRDKEMTKKVTAKSAKLLTEFDIKKFAPIEERNKNLKSKKKIKTYLPDFEILIKILINAGIDFSILTKYIQNTQTYVDILPELKKIIELFHKSIELTLLDEFIDEESYIKNEQRIIEYYYKYANNSFPISNKEKTEKENVLKLSENIIVFSSHVKAFREYYNFYYTMVNFNISLSTMNDIKKFDFSDYLLKFENEEHKKEIENKIEKILKKQIEIYNNEKKSISKKLDEFF